MCIWNTSNAEAPIHSSIPYFKIDTEMILIYASKVSLQSSLCSLGKVTFRTQEDCVNEDVNILLMFSSSSASIVKYFCWFLGWRSLLLSGKQRVGHWSFKVPIHKSKHQIFFKSSCLGTGFALGCPWFLLNFHRVFPQSASFCSWGALCRTADSTRFARVWHFVGQTTIFLKITQTPLPHYLIFLFF